MTMKLDPSAAGKGSAGDGRAAAQGKGGGATGNDVLAHALAYLRAAWSVMQIRRGGSKRPACGTWEEWQRRPMSEDDARRIWGVKAPPGIALVGGAVSGGALCYDFDAEPEVTLRAWEDLLEQESRGLAGRLAVVKTPGGGFHVVSRCADLTTCKTETLARRLPGTDHDAILIQTKGDGGYWLAPGCPPECHEDRGLYEHIRGPALTALPTISAAEREVMRRCARSLDRVPQDARRKGSKPTGPTLGDDFDRRGPDWEELFRPLGWECVRTVAGVRYWRPPGKTNPGWSATTGHCRGKDDAELLRLFSPNADPFRDGECLGKFMVFARVHHNGDCKAAARELGKQGYGEQRNRKKTGPSAPGQGPEPPKDGGQGRTDSAASEPGEKDKGPSQVQRLIGLVPPEGLFHNAAGDAWATVPPDATATEPLLTLRVDGHGLGKWLQYRYWKMEAAAPANGTVDAALKTLAGLACYDCPCHEVAVRVCGLAGGRIAVDLGGPDHQAVVIGPEGWTVRQCRAARFWRPDGMMPLPVPRRGGTLAGLWACLNVRETDRILVAGFLLGCLNPFIANPVLAVHGQEGSGKTTVAELVRQTVDMSAAPLQAPPNGEEDLLIAAINSRVVAIDNVSGLRPRMADALCRLSTGAGLTRRTLFSDQDKTTLSVRRPVLLNGIPEVVHAPDLASRVLTLHCPPLTGKTRRTEEEVKAAWRAALPDVLGCLFDACSAALGRLPDMNRICTGRLPDWERWVDAGEEALGFPAGTFARRYRNNRRAATETVLEGSPLASLLRDWCAKLPHGGWQDSATNLRQELRRVCPAVVDGPGFPANAQALTKALDRLAATLAQVGIVVDTKRRAKGRGGPRQVRIYRQSGTAKVGATGATGATIPDSDG